ncbi:MAG TPA: hypothetical protein VLV83_01895 [Acidobacteriota bacterium]|nr:hypothetical protein [Acidobacteriota bacterium]
MTTDSSRPQSSAPTVLALRETKLTQAEEEEAVITPVGIFRLVHLDQPDADTIAQRVADFDPEQFFSRDCPLCLRILDEGGDIVFNGSEVEEIEIL